MKIDYKLLREVLKHLSMIAQLGLSLVTPLLMCILLCAWLTNKGYTGGWVFIPGLILGLGASATTGYKYYLTVILKNKKEEKEKKQTVSFNDHV